MQMPYIIISTLHTSCFLFILFCLAIFVYLSLLYVHSAMLSICICFFATHCNFPIHHVTMNGLFCPFPKTWSTYIIYSRDAKHSHRSNISHQWPTTAGGSSNDIKLLLDVFVVEPFVGTRPMLTYVQVVLFFVDAVATYIIANTQRKHTHASESHDQRNVESNKNHAQRGGDGPE